MNNYFDNAVRVYTIELLTTNSSKNKVIRFIKDFHPRNSLSPPDFTDMNMLNI